MFLLRINDALSRTLMVIAAAWSFLLCFFILADIISRALNMPLQGTKELVANSVVIIVFLQVAFAVRSRSMLNADFFILLLGPRTRKMVVIAGYILGAAFFLYLAKAGIKPGLRSIANGEFDGEGALRVPVWPSRWMIVIGSTLAGINYIVLTLLEIFQKPRES